MRHFVCFSLIQLLLSAALTSMTGCNRNDASFRHYIEKEGMSVKSDGEVVSQQGMAIYGDYIFCLEDGGHALVYEKKSGTQSPIGRFDIDSSCPDQHANCINFGNETVPGASFPLLYITNGKKGGPLEFVCCVESVTVSGDSEKSFENRQVQTIVADTTGYSAAGYVPFFGCPSWLVDAKRGDIWIFSAIRRTIPSVTGAFSNNRYIATGFRIPKLSEGERVVLGVNDIQKQVTFDFDTYFTQGGCACDGKLYFCFGNDYEHNTDKLTPQRIRVYNTDTGKIDASFELYEKMSEEPEDLSVDDEYMYMNTNSPVIYRMRKP